MNAKALPVLMVVPSAVLALLLYGRRDRPLGLHVVFALHFVAFLLLLLLLQIPLRFLVWLERAGLWPWSADLSAGAASLTASAVFLFVASGRVYGSHGVARA